ncbi:hypothetical protein FPANT_10907 [Fusarium pseudoanthophilum]|uniref:Uncharacterized protein n=1 Tax=Fusarium pseudoanthophilum TaxID=48495 RepID=A0A8H5KNM7_9HYPO|nr:hypothetical protein FPANT_10907 [Fusarium pseudoanthophilum]
MPAANASNDTSMASKDTRTGANTTPLGRLSEVASSSRTGAEARTRNPFTPFSLSIGPRPRAQPQPQLPIFSSSDFPQAEARSRSSNNVNDGNTTPQTPQDISKRSFTTTEKCQAIQMCLSLRDDYLAMAPAPNYDQAPFWTKVLNEKLDTNLASKFRNWKNLKECVECWCMVRRALLREGRLPAVSQSQPELDTLVDSWNTVFAQRFFRMYRGYFESASGSQVPVSRAVTLPMASSDQSQLPELSEEVEENQPKRQRRQSPLRGPESLQGRQDRGRQNRPDMQYPDTWVPNREPQRRCEPRGFRENTVEFDNLSTRRQNHLIRTQNRTLLERLEELGPRSEEGPRMNTRC